MFMSLCSGSGAAFFRSKLCTLSSEIAEYKLYSHILKDPQDVFLYIQFTSDFHNFQLKLNYITYNNEGDLSLCLNVIITIKEREQVPFYIKVSDLYYILKGHSVLPKFNCFHGETRFAVKQGDFKQLKRKLNLVILKVPLIGKLICNI